MNTRLEGITPEAPTESAGAPIRYGIGPTPIGFAFIALTDRGVCVLDLLDDTDLTQGLTRLRHDFPAAKLIEDQAAVAPILDRVRAFIEGDRDGADLPLDLHGSPFQRRVWDALREIPAGSTRSYGDLARRLGLTEKSARAVGSACGANPVALFVPCHRALRADGGLGGFRWGVAKKRALLDRERHKDQKTLFDIWAACESKP